MNEERKRLEALVRQAEELLAETGGCHTRADREALLDMMEQAKKALAGKKTPFSRNREFLRPRGEEEIAFAYRRYTMAPTCFQEGKVYGTYGLKDAAAWYETRDMNRWDEKQLQSGREQILKQCDALLETAVCGADIGEYSFEERENVIRQRERLLTAEGTDAAGALRDFMDALYDFRLSRKHTSDTVSQPILLLPGDEAENLRGKIKRDPLAALQYERIAREADLESLEDCRMAYEQIHEKYTYEQLNKRFVIWGDTGKAVNVIAPPGTKGARLSFRLSAADHEEQGLGHIWIRGLKIISAEGSGIAIPNAGFQNRPRESAGEIAGWKDISTRNGVVRSESAEGVGSCLYLCNPKKGAEAAVVCSEVLPVEENRGYTLFFQAKQDGKMKEGLDTVLEFLDEEGKVMDRFVYRFNRKSVISTGCRSFWMQCNAIVYLVTGEITYAQKAKYDMMTFLNDFCQGAEYWLVYNDRPEGSDAYGAVQAGRIMCTTASAYSMFAGAGVMTEEEKRSFYEMVDYLLRYCLDLRNRTWMTQEKVQKGSSNWQTDMCIGAAFLMMVLTDYSDRKKWLYNAEAVLRAQLTVNLNPDGSWPESIRYHHAALEHFASFARAWRQETKEDWLLTTRLKDMFEYTIHTLTPPYVYFDGRIGTPPFGDHKLGGGEELAVYGLYLESIERLDRKLADRMHQAWTMAGCPMKSMGGESLAVENLLYLEEKTRRPEKSALKLASDCGHPDSGIYIFRRENAGGRQNYLAVMAPKKGIGHGHLDTGSLILYHDNIPVIMDSGIEGYFDTSTQWHLSSYSHACVQFAASAEDKRKRRETGKKINLDAGTYSLDRGWLDVPRTCRVTETETGTETERIVLEISHPGGAKRGTHRREISFQGETGEVRIRDTIEGYHEKILFSLPIVMKEAWAEGQTIRANGYYQVGLEVEFLSPLLRLYLEKGRTTPMFPTADEIPSLLYIRAEAESVYGFETVVRFRGPETMETEKLKNSYKSIKI